MALAIGEPPTLYEYYTGNGISSGLSDQQPYFTLNDKNISIYSGAFHYFRVPRSYWKDRLRKMRASGLNAVETYIPWNLHEPHSGIYDFGNGGSDFEDFLHVEEFLKTAQEEDLFALVRAGPYICAEWEFGGLPSWILRNSTSVRNSKSVSFLPFVKRYFSILLPILAALQFQKGGPIIAFQVENEYGNTGNLDIEYLETLVKYFRNNGISELLYTADPPVVNGLGAIPGILQTANFGSDPTVNLDKLNTLQSGKPTMVMEYWTGWYDVWSGGHSKVSVDLYKSRLEEILKYPSSVNQYMFIGSTNFGFLTGGRTNTSDNDNSGFRPIINNYDYDSPITEYGAYTAKYEYSKNLITAYNKIITKLPDVPPAKPLVSYNPIEPSGQILLSSILNTLDFYPSENVIPMELLPINNDSGQSFGYILYRKSNIDISANAELKISGYVRDTVLVMINGKLISNSTRQASDLNGFGFWRQLNSTITLTHTDIKNATLDLLVENMSRNNYGKLNQFWQFKGLTDDVFINDQKLTDWQIAPMEFKKSWNQQLLQQPWKNISTTKSTPALYRFNLQITGDAEDSYIDFREWNTGITIVNGFVLGKHFIVGPQQSLYLPAPFLQTGSNDIVVFEHFDAPGFLKFNAGPIWGYPSESN